MLSALSIVENFNGQNHGLDWIKIEEIS